jgi:hypothetical protein
MRRLRPRSNSGNIVAPLSVLFGTLNDYGIATRFVYGAGLGYRWFGGG